MIFSEILIVIIYSDINSEKPEHLFHLSVDEHEQTLINIHYVLHNCNLSFPPEVQIAANGSVNFHINSFQFKLISIHLLKVRS